MGGVGEGQFDGIVTGCVPISTDRNFFFLSGPLRITRHMAHASLRPLQGCGALF